MSRCFEIKLKFVIFRTSETFIDGYVNLYVTSYVVRRNQRSYVDVTFFYRWVRTGDEVKIGEDGEMVVLDRLKVKSHYSYVVLILLLTPFYFTRRL